MTGWRLATALLPLVLIGAATDPLAGRVAGTPVDCIDVSRNTAPVIVGPRTILYRQSGRRIWRTGPVDGCAPLRSSSKLIVESLDGARICARDRFQVREPDSIAASGYCRFDRFTPYDKPARSAR